MKKEIPILLLTGYLGSGKTTLVNNILSNRKGIKFAVIVNDIGEINVDADLIQKGGVVGKNDSSLVALQNGCICCTLKMDLVNQIGEITSTGKFDYIVIEASGVCEPEPIAQTLCYLPNMDDKITKNGLPRLDCVTTVVDALRMQSEFSCGDSLTRKNIDDEDIENLIIQQIEFCNIILLNKASEVKPEELARIKAIIKTLQPSAKIIECDYTKIDLDDILNTHLFDFNKAAGAAGWIRELEKSATPEEEREAHNHSHHGHDYEEHHHECDEHSHHHDEEGHEHCHHDHDHEGGEVEEYGIGTFVYYRRPAFDLRRFEDFIKNKWPKNIIRAKGVCYFNHNYDMSYLFEQAGFQKKVKEAGQWYATAPEEDLIELMKQEPGLMKDWDEKYGDRMQKIVFIGQKLDKEQLMHDLDECLEK